MAEAGEPEAVISKRQVQRSSMASVSWSAESSLKKHWNHYFLLYLLSFIYITEEMFVVITRLRHNQFFFK